MKKISIKIENYDLSEISTSEVLNENMINVLLEYFSDFAYYDGCVKIDESNNLWVPEKISQSVIRQNKYIKINYE